MKLRIGLATGPVSVGMIGMKIPKYCVFGETVNLATAMEERSQGELFEFDLQRILNNVGRGRKYFARAFLKSDSTWCHMNYH